MCLAYLAHVLETICDSGLDTVLHYFWQCEGSQPARSFGIGKLILKIWVELNKLKFPFRSCTTFNFHG